MYFLLFVECMLLVIVVSILFFFISYKNLMDMETFSSYECGFSLMSGARFFFSFRFFLVSILFLIFDVEIVLMLPLPYLILSDKMTLVIYFFFTILVIGLIYEYYCGSLNWLNFISKA